MNQYTLQNPTISVPADQQDISSRLAAIEKQIVQMKQQMLTYLNRQDIALCAMSKLKDEVLTFQIEDKIVKMYLPLAMCDIIQTSILQKSIFWEVEQLYRCRQYIKNDAVILDAGANIGNHTVFFSKFCNSRSVLAFEPQKTVFSVLQRNVELNDCKNVQLFNMGLADKICHGRITFVELNNIGATSFSFSDTTGSFPMTALDELNLNQLDFMKIDVEGAQYEMLRGAEKTISRYAPVIAIELRLSREPQNKAYEKEFKRPYELLRSMGYTPKEQIGPDDFIFVK